MVYNKKMKNIITSTKNSHIKKLKTLNDKKGREAINRFLVEGIKCIDEALKIEQLCEELIVLNTAKQEYERITKDFKGNIIYVSEFVLGSLSSVKTPQSIMAVCNSKKLKIPREDGLIIVLDGVSDPGNLGAIIRSADAVGASAIIPINNSADFLSPKVIRASMGSVFHIWIKNSNINSLKQLKQDGYRVYGADINGETDFNISEKKICLVIGNEAHGISDEVINLLDKKIKIPIYGKAESLNAAVAASILMYKIKNF